eukprot:2266151-Pleurochrysis_carterae.AAC.1
MARYGRFQLNAARKRQTVAILTDAFAMERRVAVDADAAAVHAATTAVAAANAEPGAAVDAA